MIRRKDSYEKVHVQTTIPNSLGPDLTERVLSGWLLLCASDLSTRWQRNGHAMVTTGTEDKGSILESGPERLLTLLRKAAGAQRSPWAMLEGVRGHMNVCLMVDNSNGFVVNSLSSNN